MQNVTINQYLNNKKLLPDVLPVAFQFSISETTGYWMNPAQNFFTLNTLLCGYI